MAPYIANPSSKLYLSLSRLHSRFVDVHREIHKLTSTFPHKLHHGVLNNLNARELPVPVAFYHPDNMDPGPGMDPTSLSSNLGEGLGTPRHHLYPTSFNHLSIWAYLALAFVVLAVATVISYTLYMCYHTAGLRVRLKTETGVGVGADAGAGGVKGGWQNLEDPIEETGVERGEGSKSTKDQIVGEKVDVNYRDEYKTDGLIHPWSERNGLGLKGLGIKLERSSKLQYDFASHPNESQASMIPGSPHSTCSLGSTSDHEHEEDLESSEGSDCPSMNAKPLAHTTEKSATHLPFKVPLPRPLPLPLPVTPSPPTQKQQDRQKRTRLRALSHILTHNLTQNQNGRETYFELQPMIQQTEKRDGGQSKGSLSETPNNSSLRSPPLSSSQFAFFAPYPNCNSTSSNSTSNLISNATFFTSNNSWGNNSSGSPAATSTPITPSTPMTPMTPATPMKSGPAGATVAELRFDSNNIQFIETPARNSNANSSVSASPPEVQGALAVASMNPLTRAEMLWNDPKLSPVQGVPIDLDGEKISSVKEVNPTEIVIAKTRATGASKLRSPSASVWQTSGILPGHVLAPTLATPDQAHRGNANLRLGYLRRRGASLSSPPSPSPSSQYSDTSASSSPSITTARFKLNRGELKKDNLRNRGRVGLGSKRKKEKMTVLTPIPRPVFLFHPQPSKSAEV